MTTPVERTQAILQTRKLLEALAARPDDSLKALDDLREQAAALLPHYPDATHMKSASWNCPGLFGKPPRQAENEEAATKPRTLSGWVGWLLFEDSERGQTVVAGIGLAGGLIALGALLWSHYFAQ